MTRESPTLKEQLAITIPRACRKGAGSDPGPGRRPGSRAARAPAGRTALPRAAGFWLVAGVLFLLLFASAAASPLYGVYQAQWRFSATTLTAVFAVYSLVLLVTLLVFGSLSDYLGRRRVIAVALAASAGACGLFLAAHGVGLLFAARALQGAAVGAAASAAGAALIDLQPDRSGRGPVVTSAATLLGLGAAGWAPARWSSTPRRPPIWSGGCSSAPPPPPPWRCWRSRRPPPGAPACWPRSGQGWPCRGRYAGRSLWPCRA